jgi:hypothetical protein
MKPIECGAIAVALGLACLAGGDAARAGGFCGDRLEGGVATKATEDEARSAAISWWSSRAGSLGRGYESWEAAADKDVTCKRDGNGKVACVASGRPCLPDGVLPDDKPRMNL